MAVKKESGGMDAAKWADVLISPLVLDDLDPLLAAFADLYAKNLLSLTHPDINGGDEKKADIYKQMVTVRDNLQINALRHEAIVRRRRQLGKSKPKQETRTSLTTPSHWVEGGWWQNEDLSYTHTQLVQTVFAYLSALAETRSAFTVDVPRHSMGVHLESRYCLSNVPGLENLDHHGVSLLVRDPFFGLITNKLRRGGGVELVVQVSGAQSYFEIALGDQLPQVYQLQPVRFDPKKEALPPGVPKSWVVFSKEGQSAVANAYQIYLKRTAAAPSPLLDPIIGSIDTVPEIQLWGGARNWSQPLFGLNPGPEAYSRVEEGFSFDLAKPLTPYMLPVIMERAPLIALNLRGNQPLFRVLGEVIAITRR